LPLVGFALALMTRNLAKNNIESGATGRSEVWLKIGQFVEVEKLE
jgi:hypothetical protein